MAYTQIPYSATSFRQVHINVQDKINKKVNQVHSYAFIRLKLVRQK